MYLPTFWKLTNEVFYFKVKKVAGWGLPASAMSKSTHELNSASLLYNQSKEWTSFTGLSLMIEQACILMPS